MKKHLFIYLLLATYALSAKPQINNTSDTLLKLYEDTFFIEPDTAIKVGLQVYHHLPNFNLDQKNQLLFDIGKQMEINQKENLYPYAEFLLKESSRLQQPILEAHANYFKGLYFHFKENWTLSEKYIKISLLQYKQLKSKEEVFPTITLITHLLINNFPDEVGNYKRNIASLLKEHRYPAYVYVSVYTNLAYTFYYSGGSLDSVYYYNQLAKKSMDTTVHYNIHNRFLYYINQIQYGLQTGRLTIAEKAIQDGFEVPHPPQYSFYFFLTSVIKFYLSDQVKNYPRAEQYCREIILRSKYDEYVCDAYKNLSEIYYHKNNLDSFRKFTLLGDQFYNSYIKSNNRQNIIVLEKEMKSEVLRFENSKIANLLHQKKNQNYYLILFLCSLLFLIVLLVALIINYKKYNGELDSRSRKLVSLNNKLLSEIANHDKTSYLLKESNDKLTTIAQRVAHDIANPLTAVVFNTEIIKRKAIQYNCSGIQENTEEILQNCLRAKILIKEVLNTSIINTKVRAYPIDLNTILKEVLSMLKPKLELIESEIKSDELPGIVGFRSEMLQLFINFISNSIKYKKSDQPLLLFVKYIPMENNYYQLIFEDNGKGISEKNINSIFDLYTTEKSDDDSYGIGLYTCKQIVKSYLGEIMVKSTLGVGSQFIITLSKLRDFNT